MIVKFTVAIRARMRGIRDDIYPSAGFSACEFDSPVIATQAKRKIIPTICALASFSLNTEKNSMAIRNGVRLYRFITSEKLMPARSADSITSMFMNCPDRDITERKVTANTAFQLMTHRVRSPVVGCEPKV